MKPIIFLDIDGVVNTYYWGNYPHYRNGEFSPTCAVASDGKVSNYQAICWLNYLYELCPYDIVISSKTWREEPNCNECLYNTGLNKKIRIIGKTKTVDVHDQSYCRGLEIKAWIEENKFQGKFAILDDDSDMGELKDFLVKCNTYYGFGLLEMEKALEKIKRR